MVLNEESTTIVRHLPANEEHAGNISDLFLRLFDVCKNEPKSFEPEVKSYVTLIFAYLTEKDLFDKNNVRKENVEFCETLLKYIILRKQICCYMREKWLGRAFLIIIQSRKKILTREQVKSIIPFNRRRVDIVKYHKLNTIILAPIQ